MRFLVVLLAAFAVLPLWKLLGVIISDGGALAERSRVQGAQQQSVPALRGAILDRNGAELAISVPRVRLAANVGELGELAQADPRAEGRFVAAVAEVADVPERDLMAAIQGADPTDPWVKLVDSVTPEQADELRSVLAESGLLAALVVEDTSERLHPSGDSGLRIIGTVGPDGPGPGAGVERVLDSELTGTDGKKVVERSPSGDVIAGTERTVASPRPGSSVFLTLDRNLQYEAERVLMQGAASAGASGGIAVVGRPATGELLAVAGVERDSETGELGLADSPMAFSNAYQAGSVFKLVPVSAAIERGLVDLDTTMSVPSSIQLYDRTFTDHDAHPTEAMTVRDIVARSSNVGTIQIAEELGEDALHDALVDFGFGRRTGIANPAESAGILPDVADWNGPDIGASAIGTLQSATAVQLWAAYNVIANDGRYVAPRLVDRLVRADGSSSRPEPGTSRKVLSPDTAHQVETALRAVVTEGTGKKWDLPGFPAAAKTGTSRMPSPERVDPNDGYVWADGTYHYVNAFTGYLPVNDPEVSITVLLEDVAPGFTGSSGAGPIFSELARLAIREMGIVPTVTGAAPSGVRAPAATGVAPTTATAGPGTAAVSSRPGSPAAERPPGDTAAEQPPGDIAAERPSGNTAAEEPPGDPVEAPPPEPESPAATGDG